MSDTPLGYYKWYPRDFAMSSIVRRMSVTAKGVYRELLDLQWEDSGVPLTEDDAKAIIHATDEEWAQFSPYFLSCFPGGKNPILDEQREKSVNAIKKQSESGKLGGKLAGKGRPKGKSGVHKGNDRGTSNPTTTEPETYIKEKTTKRTAFVRPTLEEVQTFMGSEGFDGITHAPEFFDYYQSNGWKAGKNPMVDWQAAARGWCRRSRGQSQNGKPVKKELYHE